MGALAVEAVELDAVDETWRALAEAAENPFATVEWRDAWLAHSGVTVEPRIHVARREDSSIAVVLPLVLVRGRYLRKLRFAGFGAGNMLGPISAPADHALAAAALHTAVARNSDDCDLFVGDALLGPEWSTFGGRVASEPQPRVHGPWSSWDDYLASRSSNLRQEVRRKERKLLERGLTMRTVERADELEPALDTLFRLHRARWGDEAAHWFAGVEELHRAFARSAHARGWLRLHVYELEGRAAAAYLGYRLGATEWYYQLGRVQEPQLESLGRIAVALALRSAIESGVATFDLGPGGQPYKHRFATDDARSSTVTLPCSLRGRLVRALRRAR